MAGKLVRTGTPGVFKTEAGRYQVMGYDPLLGGGSRHVGTEDTYKLARERKRQFEDQKAQRGSGSATCDGYQADWCTGPVGGTFHAREATTTNLHNRERTKAFAADFAGVRLRDVSRKAARAWAAGGELPGTAEFVQLAARWQGVERLRSGKLRVPAHIGNVPAVRAMFADAIVDGQAEFNPFAALGINKSRGRRDIVPLTLVELDKVCEIAMQAHGDYGERYAALIAFAAYSGMRPGEIFALRWEDVDFEERTIRVAWQLRSRTKERARPKSGKERTITLAPRAAEALGVWPKDGPDGAIFTTKWGKPYQGRTHHYYWNPVRSAFAASLPPTHWLPRRIKENPEEQLDFYELRHFCASFLADHGASPQDIAIQLGHQDGGRLAQSLYIHSYQDNARARLRAVFEGAEGGEAAA